MKNRWGIVLVMIFVCVAQLPAETRWEQRSREKQQMRQGIAWPSHEPLRFHLRRGTRTEDWPEVYERQHDPANIKRMADLGVQMLRLHFYKGFGLDLEKAEIEKSKQMADLMHRYGMKVSLYVAGTMFVEGFYREVPEAINWEQRDQNNRFVPYLPYGTQTYRHFPCSNNLDYRNYIKQVLKIGVEEFKADQIFFDNVHTLPEPKSCHCPNCVAAFREFLRQRYPTPEACERRFGYPNPDYVQLPQWDEFCRPESLMQIDDPILQEWIRFRCESLANQYIDYYNYLKGLNPKVSVGFNLKGIYGFNRMWLNGVYHPLYAGHCDFTPYDVTGMEPRIHPQTGALISEIRSYKMARRLDLSCDDALGDDLNCAQNLAFNYQKPVPGFGHQGGPFLRGAYNVFTPMIEFFREYNERYLTNVDSVADVAVVRCWPSMAYSVGDTLAPTILMEQVLIQHKIPFDILFDEKLDKIERYGAIVLPGQESISKELVDRLLAYARQGGTLVFTGNTADYNDWRETRRVNPLRALLGSVPSGAVTKNEGKGRLVYIPEIIPDDRPHPAAAQANTEENPEVTVAPTSRRQRFAAADWMLPKNHQEIARLISDNLPKGISIATQAPLTTVMEMVNRAESRETIVHFLNFDREHRLKPFDVGMKKQFSGSVKSVSYLSPEFDDPQPVRFKESGDRLDFTVPATQIYGMIVIGHGR